jgi:peptide/nickel transport system permease protein
MRGPEFLYRNVPGIHAITHGNPFIGVVLLATFLSMPCLAVFQLRTFVDSLVSFFCTAALLVLDPARRQALTQFDAAAYWVAAGGLVVLPLVLWYMHRRWYFWQHAGASKEAHGLLRRTVLVMTQSKQAYVGIAIIMVITAFAIVAPFIVSWSPFHFQDGTITQFCPPLHSVMALSLKPPVNQEPHASISADGSLTDRLYRTALSADSRLENGHGRYVMHITSYRVAGDSVYAKAGDRQFALPLSSLSSTDPSVFIVQEKHIFGTDSYGRDLLSRILHGARVSLALSVVAVLLSAILGTIIGLAAGYFGGRIDSVLMRFVDMMLAFPSFFLILICIAMFEALPVPRLSLIMIIIGVTSWMGVARLVRSETLSIKERSFVRAAKALGIGHARVLFLHILPNTLSTVIVNTALRIGGIILLESALSFLNLGVQPPTPSWGNIVYEGKDFISTAWWISTIPGLIIAITVIAFNLAGDGLRDAINPMRVEK